MPSADAEIHSPGFSIVAALLILPVAFSEVEVEVKPAPGGLLVTFILEPAPYFGVFEFPGATKGFSYTRLLQVVDIPNQTPYKPEVVSKAAGNLLNFFVSAGYFQAQVQPEPQFDETHMLANVVFHVDLGKLAKVGNVKFADGNLPKRIAC